MPLWLKKNEERRLLSGHLWVFANEIDQDRSPLSGFAPGQEIAIFSRKDRPLGVGYVNPGSLIAARILARPPEEGGPFDQAFFADRLAGALRVRARLGLERNGRMFGRMVHGEGDFLPGLVLDRYSDVVVAQILTAGMEKLREPLLAAIREVFTPAGIVLRCDSGARALEGLPRAVESLGAVPEFLEIEENGTSYRVPALTGQKTGWFYDQRDNRAALLGFVPGRRVLDVYCYAGAFGVAAAKAGADKAVCLDASAQALGWVAANAEQNGVADRLETVQGDALESMRALFEAGERFDVINLDPPAFIKRRKDLAAGLTAYEAANRAAVALLAEGGALLTSSCSRHLPAEDLRQIARRAFWKRPARLVMRLGQGPDHPVHPAMEETEYLKSLLYLA